MIGLDSHQYASRTAVATTCRTGTATSSGKVILAGEHAVVYGKHALAVPIRLAAQVSVFEREDLVKTIRVPHWGLAKQTALPACPPPLTSFLQAAIDALRLNDTGWDVSVDMQIPRGSGLGGSAALAVAFIRALGQTFHLQLSDEAVNEAAFLCEKVAHGTPSGVDNSVATYERAILFCKAPRLLQPVCAPRKPVLLGVGFTGDPGMTLAMVDQVRQARIADQTKTDAIFDAIDACALQAQEALEAGDIKTLGSIMNENHALLQALGVSSPSLDRLVKIARDNGALGAKLTGGGGGGAMIAVVADDGKRVGQAFENAGFLFHTFRL